MQQFIVKTYFLRAVILIVSLQPCLTSREISGLLDEAKGLTNAEMSVLMPLFEELQLQYDFVVSEAPQEFALTDELFGQEYEATLKEFEEQLNKILLIKATTTYNISLPTLEEIIGKPDLSLMTKEQRLEFLDLQRILQDTLEDTQINLNKLIAQALKLETSLLKGNKQVVVTLIFKALRTVYKAAGRIGRAAYCTYSQLPQLNTSLHTLYEGVDCYMYTTSLILKVQNETYQTVKIVRRNAFELAAVYIKVAKQNSLMGKIVTVIMNITKIASDILETIQTAKHALDAIENQLPAAAQEASSCSSNVIPQIPFVVETVSNVTQCIRFKDETTISYDFLKSEEEYNRSIYNDLPDATVDEEDDDETK